MEAIIASILGGLVSGLFTFLGVWLTIRHENKKTHKEELKRQKEKDEQLFEKRPRLEIIKYKQSEKYSIPRKADACVLVCHIRDYKIGSRAMFYYDESTVKPENWVYAEYTFRNVGRTAIESFSFSINLPRDTVLFNVLNKENVHCYENHFLNYQVILDKSVKPQETVTLRVCFIEKQIIFSNIGNPLITLWMVDENNNWWCQSLYAPENKIENSSRTSYKTWLDYTNIETAIKCFENQMLW